MTLEKNPTGWKLLVQAKQKLREQNLTNALKLALLLMDDMGVKVTEEISAMRAVLNGVDHRHTWEFIESIIVELEGK